MPLRDLPRVVVLGTLLAGCSHHVFSLPARGPTLRAVHTVPVGTTAVQASAHAQSALFGPAVAGGSVAVRHGVREDVELAVDAALFSVTEPSGAGVNKSIFMGRVEGRFNPGRNRVVALFVGFGGGHAPAGGSFFSADVGVALAFENCYATPFFSVAGLISVPFDTRDVDTRLAVDDEPRISRAQITGGTQMALGLRVPLGGYARCPRVVAPVTLVVAITGTRLDDGVEQEGLLGGSAGIELRF